MRCKEHFDDKGYSDPSFTLKPKLLLEKGIEIIRWGQEEVFMERIFKKSNFQEIYKYSKRARISAVQQEKK